MNTELDWLMNLQLFGMKPGLGRMEELLRRFGNPQQQLETVLIGGTNGKGSTASLLAAMLSAAGRRTGLFTSPHLTEITERFVVDGTEASLEQLKETLRSVRPAAEELGATFFEVVVLCAWLLFRDAGCDTAVFEVGLGGRFDATNTADPRVSVITGVDLDHTAVLGNSVAEIAADKACIGRSGRPLFTAARGEALAVIREHAGKHGTDVRAAGTDFQAELLGSDWSGNRIRVREGSWELEFDVALPGPYQLDNAALAAVAARELGADDTALTEGAAAVRWPG